MVMSGSKANHKMMLEIESDSTSIIPYHDDVVCDFCHGYWKIADCKLNQVGYHDIIDRRLLLQLSE